MRSKLSHASNLLLYSEESRAAKVTVFVLMALAFCWVPYFSMILVNLFVDNGPPKWANFLGIICGLSNSAISPILYAFRSKRVQRDVKKALGLFSSRRKSSRHVLRKRITKENKNQLEQNFREIDFTKKLHSKIKRVKSLSCPQLLVSSVGENESSTTCTLSSASKTFQDQKIICDGDNEEHQPMLLAKMFTCTRNFFTSSMNTSYKIISFFVKYFSVGQHLLLNDFISSIIFQNVLCFNTKAMTS